MDFRSDNVTGAHSDVLAALGRANQGTTTAYGEDDLTRKIESRIADLFECDARVFLVATGTAANAISLAALAPPYGAVFCHGGAHVSKDECGAPEFYSGGAKLLTLPDRGGRIEVGDMEAVVAKLTHGVHNVKPTAISITQAAETGVVYSLAQVRAIADFAKARGYRLHMDGARFANAFASLGCSPAEATWRAGVDILCFGASKNGALAAEAIVVFDRRLADEVEYRRKRGGHLFSKMRFIAAQFDAYLSDSLWLANARHANAMATRLGEGLAALPGARLLYPVEANEVFPELPEPVIRGLQADGFNFHRWGAVDSRALRLVCAFNTTPQSVEAFLASAKRYAN
jgi:threonine aldolase